MCVCVCVCVSACVVCVKVCLKEREADKERGGCMCEYACWGGGGRVCVCECVRARAYNHVCVSVESSDRRKRSSITKKNSRVSGFTHHWTEDSSNKLQTKTRSKVGLVCCEMGLLSPDRQRQSSVLSPVEGGC